MSEMPNPNTLVDVDDDLGGVFSSGCFDKELGSLIPSLLSFQDANLAFLDPLPPLLVFVAMADDAAEQDVDAAFGV